MLQAALAAKLRERTLGDDVVRALGHAEVGAAVTDHDAGAGFVGTMGAFAIARLGPTINLSMRKRQAPAIAALPLQAVGKKWNGQAFAFEQGPHDTIETIGNDGQAHAATATEGDKGMKGRINPHGANGAVEVLWRCAQQRGVARHALPRGYSSRLPRRLDVAPGRVCKLL